MKRKNKLLAISCCFLLLSSCDSQKDLFDPKKNDLIDPEVKLSREDFSNMRDLASLKAPPSGALSAPVISAGVSEPPLPELAEILAAPRPPKVAEAQVVSVAVTDDVPIKDLLIELGRKAGVDIEVDSSIRGGISLIARERPFNEVIERIAKLAGLRYSVKNNVLRVERDTPYIETYTLDMLNIDRSATGSLDIGSNSSGGGGTSTGGATGGSSGGTTGSTGSSSGSNGGGTSTSNITADSKGEFWEKFKETLDRIITYQESSMTSSASVAVQAPPAPADGSAPAAAPAPVSSPSGISNSAGNGSFYSLNRQAGMLTVSGTERQHDIVRNFLRAIESNISSQVLIEAKIVEVTLNDRYQSGINWQQLGSTSVNFSGSDFDAVASANSNRGAGLITIVKNDLFSSGINLNAAVKLLDEFGTTRALSSPRLNAMNNQQAVLSFVENLQYFKVEIKVTDGVPVSSSNPIAIPAKVEVKSDPLIAPVGISLALQPSINKDTNEVTLSVRPTLSKVTQFVSDPGFEISKAQAAAQLTGDALTALLAVQSRYPQLEVRQLDSILKIGSGQVMVIGGLLEDKITNSDAGVPAVSEVPYIGNLFKSVDKTTTKKELVILLRATIVSPHGSADDADKATYEKFMQDPRPLKF